MTLVAGVGQLDAVVQGRRLRRRDRTGGPAGKRAPPRRDRGGSAALVGGVDDGQCRAARRRSCPGRRRPAARHGGPGLDGRRGAPGPVVERPRSAADAADLVAERGAASWAEAVGSVPLASFTVTKLRWLARAEPENAGRVETVLLPHDWLTWQILGRPADKTTDRGDASGTGYWSPQTGEYRMDLLEASVRPCGHGAHGLGTEPAGRIHRRRCGRRGRHRGQHGCRPWVGPDDRGRGRLDRNEWSCQRRPFAALGRSHRKRRRFLRRDRTVPAVGVHAQRCPSAVVGRATARA